MENEVLKRINRLEDKTENINLSVVRIETDLQYIKENIKIITENKQRRASWFQTVAGRAIEIILMYAAVLATVLRSIK